MKRINPGADLPPVSNRYSLLRLCMGIRKASTLALSGSLQNNKNEAALRDSSLSDEQGAVPWMNGIKRANSFHFNEKNWYVNPPQVISIPKLEIEMDRNRKSSESTAGSSSVESLTSSNSNFESKLVEVENNDTETSIGLGVGNDYSGNAYDQFLDIPHFSAAARAYNEARQGKERILLQERLGSVFVNGEQGCKRKNEGFVFLVLTSEAYYLLRGKKSEEGVFGLGLGESFNKTRLRQQYSYRRKIEFGIEGESETIMTKLRDNSGRRNTYSNGVSVRGNSDSFPELIWRRPYRAVERICIGGYGLAFCMSHRNSDIPNKHQVETFVAVCHGEGLAVKLHNTFKQMCGEWLSFERSFVADCSLLKPLRVEAADDVLQCAIKGALKIIEPETTFSLKRKDGTFQGVFCAHVRIKKDNKRIVENVLLLTKKTFALLTSHFNYWKFPPDHGQAKDQKQLEWILSTTNDTHKITQNRIQVSSPRLDESEGYPQSLAIKNEGTTQTYTMLFYDFDILMQFRQFLKQL